jgi:hypothetical protein
MTLAEELILLLRSHDDARQSVGTLMSSFEEKKFYLVPGNFSAANLDILGP